MATETAHGGSFVPPTWLVDEHLKQFGNFAPVTIQSATLAKHRARKWSRRLAKWRNRVSETVYVFRHGIDRDW